MHELEGSRLSVEAGAQFEGLNVCAPVGRALGSARGLEGLVHVAARQSTERRFKE